MCKSAKFSATRMTPSFTSVGSNHCTFEDIKEVSKLYFDTPFEFIQSKTKWHLTRFCIFLGEQVIGVAVGPAELQSSDDSLCQNVCGVVALLMHCTFCSTNVFKEYVNEDNVSKIIFELYSHNQYNRECLPQLKSAKKFQRFVIEV